MLPKDVSGVWWAGRLAGIRVRVGCVWWDGGTGRVVDKGGGVCVWQAGIQVAK